MKKGLENGEWLINEIINEWMMKKVKRSLYRVMKVVCYELRNMFKYFMFDIKNNVF